MQIDVLKSMIGHGSSATVWIARTEKLTDFVAIKIYHSYEYEDIARRVSVLSHVIGCSKANRSMYPIYDPRFATSFL